MTNKHQEAADELYLHRHDFDEWEEDEAVIEVRPSHTSVVTFRLPTAEFHRLEQEAQNAGQSLSEYIRAALAAYMGANK